MICPRESQRQGQPGTGRQRTPLTVPRPVLGQPAARCCSSAGSEQRQADAETPSPPHISHFFNPQRPLPGCSSQALTPDTALRHSTAGGCASTPGTAPSPSPWVARDFQVMPSSRGRAGSASLPEVSGLEVSRVSQGPARSPRLTPRGHKPQELSQPGAGEHGGDTDPASPSWATLLCPSDPSPSSATGLGCAWIAPADPKYPQLLLGMRSRGASRAQAPALLQGSSQALTDRQRSQTDRRGQAAAIPAPPARKNSRRLDLDQVFPQALFDMNIKGASQIPSAVRGLENPCRRASGPSSPMRRARPALGAALPAPGT